MDYIFGGIVMFLLILSAAFRKKDVGKTRIYFYFKKSKNKERAKKIYYDLKSLK